MLKSNELISWNGDSTAMSVVADDLFISLLFSGILISSVDRRMFSCLFSLYNSKRLGINLVVDRSPEPPRMMKFWYADKTKLFLDLWKICLLNSFCLIRSVLWEMGQIDEPNLYDSTVYCERAKMKRMQADVIEPYLISGGYYCRSLLERRLCHNQQQLSKIPNRDTLSSIVAVITEPVAFATCRMHYLSFIKSMKLYPVSNWSCYLGSFLYFRFVQSLSLCSQFAVCPVIDIFRTAGRLTGFRVQKRYSSLSGSQPQNIISKACHLKAASTQYTGYYSHSDIR